MLTTWAFHVVFQQRLSEASEADQILDRRKRFGFTCEDPAIASHCCFNKGSSEIVEHLELYIRASHRLTMPLNSVVAGEVKDLVFDSELPIVNEIPVLRGGWFSLTT